MPDISGVASNPLLYGVLVVIGYAVWLAEKVTGANGVFTRIKTAWDNREINRLVREKKVREARLALEQLEESAVIRQLRTQVADLSAEMEWNRRERLDLAAREHHRAEFDRAIAQWINQWVPRARAAGLDIPDPPQFIELPPVVLPRWPGADVADRRVERAPGTNPQGRRVPPPPPSVWHEDDGDEDGMPQVDPRASAR